MFAFFFLPVCELNTSYCLFGQKEINAGVFLAQALFAKSKQIHLGHLVGLTLPVAMTSSELMNPLDSNIVAHYHRNMSRSKDRSRTVATWHREKIKQRLFISCGTGDQERWVSMDYREVNAATVKDAYQVLRIENSLCSKVVLHIRPSVWVLAVSDRSSYQWPSCFCNHFGTL